MPASRDIYRLLGELLEYPRADLPAKARECHALLREGKGIAKVDTPPVTEGAGSDIPSSLPHPNLLPEGEGDQVGLGVSPNPPLSSGDCMGAARLMEDFASFMDETPMGQLEELYTSTFDLKPSCCPYVGYHLLGDNPHRSELMARLRQSFREAGFDAGTELPDHAAVLFKFLAVQRDPELEHDLVEVLLGPGLQKMANALDEKNGYGKLIRSASIVMSNE